MLSYSRRSWWVQRVSLLHLCILCLHFQTSSEIFHVIPLPRSHLAFFFCPGVRTEQDLYARLIDSVTKQVGELHPPPSHEGNGLSLKVDRSLCLSCLPSSPYPTRDRTRIQKCAEFSSHMRSCAGEPLHPPPPSSKLSPMRPKPQNIHYSRSVCCVAVSLKCGFRAKLGSRFLFF